MLQCKTYFYVFSLLVSCVFCSVHASNEINQVALATAQKKYVEAVFLLASHRYFVSQLQVLQPTVLRNPEYLHELLLKDLALYTGVYQAGKAIEVAIMILEPRYSAERQRIEKAKADYRKNPMCLYKMRKNIEDAQREFGEECGWKPVAPKNSTIQSINATQKWVKKYHYS